MTGEYVKFSGLESIYGQKKLLSGELDLLNFIKKIKRFKRLRREDIALRLALKTKIQESLADIEELEKFLPPVRFVGNGKKENREEKSKEEQDILTLDQELEVIRRKLEKLDRGG